MRNLKLITLLTTAWFLLGQTVLLTHSSEHLASAGSADVPCHACAHSGTGAIPAATLGVVSQQHRAESAMAASPAAPAGWRETARGIRGPPA